MTRAELTSQIFNTIYEVDKQLDVHPDYYLVAAEAVINTIEKAGIELNLDNQPEPERSQAV